MLLHVGLLPPSDDEGAARARLAALGDELARAVGEHGEVEEPVSDADQVRLSHLQTFGLFARSGLQPAV